MEFHHRLVDTLSSLRRYSASILCDDVVLAQLLPKLNEDFPKAEISVKSNEQVSHQNDISVKHNF